MKKKYEIITHGLNEKEVTFRQLLFHVKNQCFWHGYFYEQNRIDNFSILNFYFEKLL